MPQVCTVCTHPKANIINAMILRGEGSKRGIAQRFSVTDDSIIRHIDSHLADKVQRALVRQEKQEAIDLPAELANCFHFAKKLRAACDDWLTDPDQTDAYTLDPRDTDVDVIYKEKVGEQKDGAPIWERKRAKLSRLLRKIEDDTIQVDRGEVKHADPRKLILEALATFDKHLRMFGDLTGLFVKKVELSGEITVNHVEQMVLLHTQIHALAEREQMSVVELFALPSGEFAERVRAGENEATK